MQEAVTGLAELLRGRRTVALTGAGCSTESGIPDYRGAGTARRARAPMMWRTFAGDPAAQARYWARSLIGWPRFSAARPNPAHRALAALEERGALAGLLTQNVDRLHHAAGSRRVVELHGALEEVRCLGCPTVTPRAALQARLEAGNPGWAARSATLAPDGDADLAAEELSGFAVPACAACGGVLRPSVVFFGEGVPAATVASAAALVNEAEALLVVGSSLAVFSGLRFVRRAAARGLPIAIVNLEPTRGDELATLRVAAPAGQVLPALAEALAAP